ncbi:MAG: hypothetical protein KIPDCIKN_04361 [Haliscomenobacter sp.]|nr:hypothetical protein [Haliscomenobacter sp.]
MSVVLIRNGDRVEGGGPVTVNPTEVAYVSQHPRSDETTCVDSKGNEHKIPISVVGINGKEFRVLGSMEEVSKALWGAAGVVYDPRLGDAPSADASSASLSRGKAEEGKRASRGGEPLSL